MTDTDTRTTMTENVLAVLKDRLLHCSDAVRSYQDIINDIRTELGMDEDTFKQQFLRDRQFPHGYIFRRYEYLWLLNVRMHYAEYLRDILKRQHRPAIGIPVFIDDAQNYHEGVTSFRLAYATIGTMKFDRDYYFEKDDRQGTEVVYLEPHTRQGYQFWIVTWSTFNDDLTITVSTWMIHHDKRDKRNTLYLARTYTFQEVPDFDPSDTDERNIPNPITYNPSLKGVTDRARRLAFATAKEVTAVSSPPDDGWVLVASPYSISESQNNLRYLLEQFDMEGIIETMKDTYFRKQWFRLMARLFWYDADGYLRSADRIDESGLLKHDWFRPITTHPRDAEQYEKNREQFIKVRDAYNDWSDRFWRALNGADVDLSDDPEFPDYPLHRPSPD